jgi:hypothetical protein
MYESHFTNRVPQLGLRQNVVIYFRGKQNNFFIFLINDSSNKIIKDKKQKYGNSRPFKTSFDPGLSLASTVVISTRNSTC